MPGSSRRARLSHRGARRTRRRQSGRPSRRGSVRGRRRGARRRMRRSLPTQSPRPRGGTLPRRRPDLVSARSSVSKADRGERRRDSDGDDRRFRVPSPVSIASRQTPAGRGRRGRRNRSHTGGRRDRGRRRAASSRGAIRSVRQPRLARRPRRARRVWPAGWRRRRSGHRRRSSAGGHRPRPRRSGIHLLDARQRREQEDHAEICVGRDDPAGRLDGFEDRGTEADRAGPVEGPGDGCGGEEEVEVMGVAGEVGQPVDVPRLAGRGLQDARHRGEQARAHR